MIEHYIPSKRGRVGLLHGEMSTAARTAALEAFTDAMTENKQGQVVRRRRENLQILLGTTPMLSKGLQLTRAANVVMMEPDHEFARELQGYARVNRIGQRNPWTFTYRLVDDGSTVESAILARQEERGEFPGRMIKPDRAEKIAPNNYSIERLVLKNTKQPSASKEDSEKRLALKDINKELGRGRSRIRRIEGINNLRLVLDSS